MTPALPGRQATNRHQRFRCLLCPDTAVFDNETSINLHSDHPKQPLISDELLLAQFGTKADEPEHNEINVFNCPYCDRQRLSISTLYDHLTLEHLDVPFSVRCPVCVCFRGHVSIPNGKTFSAYVLYLLGTGGRAQLSGADLQTQISRGVHRSVDGAKRNLPCVQNRRNVTERDNLPSAGTSWTTGVAV
ncbi:conserved hypothetical protein [Culex quinquefasciatus]|uniref:Di19 zinc-binding domain-containing protein n=1 Tax=Culex quinquefasciatus TaxID=7176 RepID=B0W2G4_CULQU|nr:conserved hypothetical protein [Culex quinquefasciatus]|eukprot:XP_001842867.1 conserved hypothetical protein [Culex quinquefasciatus]